MRIKFLSGEFNNRKIDFKFGIAITESLFPDRGYEIAVRNSSHVLFGFISWASLKKGKVNFDYVSVRMVNDEHVKVDLKDSNSRLIVTANAHLEKLVKRKLWNV